MGSPSDPANQRSLPAGTNPKPDSEPQEQPNDVQTTDDWTEGLALTIDDLIDRYHASVYRYLYRLAGNGADAEDLAQQTFLIAHQRMHQIREPGKAKAWLLTVARSCFLKMGRRRRPVDAATLELDVDLIPTEIEENELVDSERLQMALNQLDENQRVILMMFYFQQLSYQEISEQLDIKIGTVMSRLSRAKSRLRGVLLSLEKGGPVPK